MQGKLTNANMPVSRKRVSGTYYEWTQDQSNTLTTGNIRYHNFLETWAHILFRVSLTAVVECRNRRWNEMVEWSIPVQQLEPPIP